MTRKVILLALILLVSCKGNQEKNATFQNQGNPLFRDTFTADPAPMLAPDGRLYVFCGHDELYDDRPGFEGKHGYNLTEWLCYSTADMQKWTAHGTVLKPSDFAWADTEAWAAQCVEANGKYYLYVTTQNREPAGKAIGVAVADRPEGPYKDAIGQALILDEMTPNGPLGQWNDIHPSVMMDSDGTPWLCWGKGMCFLARLKKNMTELDGKILTLNLENYVEAPWLYMRNGLYYLVYTSMGPGRETISYAVARNIMGPWEYKGELTGMVRDCFSSHSGVIDFNGKSYLFYHNATLSLNGYGPSMGRRNVCVDELQYNPDGTIRPVEQTLGVVSK